MKFTSYHFQIIYPLLIGALCVMAVIGERLTPNTPTTTPTTHSFPWEGGGD